MEMDKKILAQQYPGEWVLLFNDEIVDHSAKVEDILKTCEEKYPETSFPNDDIKIKKIFHGTPRDNLLDL
jgi:hypothetical protein